MPILDAELGFFQVPSGDDEESATSDTSLNQQRRLYNKRIFLKKTKFQYDFKNLPNGFLFLPNILIMFLIGKTNQKSKWLP